MLKHVPGTKMGKADSLSRRPDWKVGVERDNEDEMLVKKEWLENSGGSGSIRENKTVKSKG